MVSHDRIFCDKYKSVEQYTKKKILYFWNWTKRSIFENGEGLSAPYRQNEKVAQG